MFTETTCKLYDIEMEIEYGDIVSSDIEYLISLVDEDNTIDDIAWLTNLIKTVNS